MLKERLKEIDLRITEIADYLNLSRPTVYKFIDCYDKKQFRQIDGKALKLFNFIEENALAGKHSVISYILNNLTPSVTADVDDGIISYLKENPHSKKSRFIADCAQSDVFDKVIYYLADIRQLLDKDNLSLEERELIAPYKELIKKITEKKS